MDRDIAYDPFVIFIFFTVAIPLVKLSTAAERFAYVTDFWLLAVLAATVAAWYYTHFMSGAKPLRLSARDRRAARWYLLNATVIHIMMDGLVGAFHRIPAFDNQYKVMDKRFTVDDPAVYTVSLTECFAYSPMCILVYYGYWHGSSWRRPLEIAVGAFQIFGTIIFLVTELLVGCKHIPVDYNFEFTEPHITYFWFGFIFCNPIWIVVPLVYMWQAARELTAIVQQVEPRARLEERCNAAATPNGTNTTRKQEDGRHRSA